jgi:glutamate-1-semialdehyde 2,1-aminomutase
VVQVREPGSPADGLLARSLIQQEMVRRGVLFNGNNFICLAHSQDDLDHAAEAYDAAFGRLAEGLGRGAAGVAALLEGEAVSPAFRPVR